ncbi:MAG: hypothetical protein Q8O15_11875 [Rectinemataceae bacterium]|nr:hypothetical protein [Rectinemataceae bacterium]
MKTGSEQGRPAGLAIRIIRFAVCIPLILIPGCSTLLPRAPFSEVFNGGIENRSSVPVRIIADSRSRNGYIRLIAPGESTSQRLEDVDFVENPLTHSWKKINPVLVPPSGYLVLTDDMLGADWPQLTERTGLSYVRHIVSGTIPAEKNSL